MQFQCVMWITRHSSIWIANNSIHCSLPTQLRKLAKSGSWHCHLQWQRTWSCVTYLMQERYQWKEDELLFTCKYATCKFSNLLTLEQWAFEYGLPFLYALYMPPNLSVNSTHLRIEVPLSLTIIILGFHQRHSITKYCPFLYRATCFGWNFGHHRDHPEQTNMIMCGFSGTVAIRCHFGRILEICVCLWSQRTSLAEIFVGGQSAPLVDIPGTFSSGHFGRGAEASHSVHFGVAHCRKPYHNFKNCEGQVHVICILGWHRDCSVHFYGILSEL